MIPFTEENKATVIAAGEILCNQCTQSAEDVLRDAFGDEELDLTDVDIKLLYELDNITLQCESCGWYVEAHDVNEDGVCSDCAEEEEDGE